MTHSKRGTIDPGEELFLVFAPCINGGTHDRAQADRIAACCRTPRKAYATDCARTSARLPAKLHASVVIKLSGPAQPKQTVPTGLSGEPPPGPAMPVMDTAQSAWLRCKPAMEVRHWATQPPVQDSAVASFCPLARSKSPTSAGQCFERRLIGCGWCGTHDKAKLAICSTRTVYTPAKKSSVMTPKPFLT
jgi:hypothetical protein